MGKLTIVEGIGEVYESKLLEVGINNLDEYLEKAKTKKGRVELAESTGISEKLILNWANHIDLFRIHGVRGQFAELLEAAGVDTVMELAQRNPQNLHLKMKEVNAEKNLVRRVPGEGQITDWINQAKELDRVLEY